MSFLPGSSPLTCLAWEALPVAYATASIALGIGSIIWSGSMDVDEERRTSSANF